MDYEKKYKEALSWMQSLYNGLHGATKKDAEHFFPELKESEDEKIRKELIAIYSVGAKANAKTGDIPDRDIVAWLEKQGEQKYVPAWMPKFLDELRSKKNYFDWDEHRDIEGGILAIIKWMNPNYFNGKDDRQKPTDKIEPRQEKLTEFERAVKQVMEEAIECGDTHNLKADAEMLLSLVHNSSWSEEDEKLLDKVIKRLHKYSAEDEEYLDKYYWLKELKHRVQPQSTWKPSDEQMDALRYVTNFDYGGYKATLVSLYEQLKKLRGE